MTPVRRTLHIMPGYTVLVFDANVLLNSLALFSSLLESCRWTLVVPLVVLTELDSLKNSPGAFSGPASKAIAYVEHQVRLLPLHLKVQTSRGNYLSCLKLRQEELDLRQSGLKTTSELVLQAAQWQQTHFINRLALLNPSAPRSPPDDVSKVAVVSFDRQLRLKARARSIETVNEHEVLRCVLPKLAPNG